MEIWLAPGVVDYVCRQADRGYEAPYKEERLGFLFGPAPTRERWVVLDAHYYKGGTRTGTSSSYNVRSLVQRGLELESPPDSSWVGIYHTHVEKAGRISFGLSEVDKNSAPYLGLEVLVTVWATSSPAVPSPGSYRLKVRKEDYSYLFTGYVRKRRQFHITKVLCPWSDDFSQEDE